MNELGHDDDCVGCVRSDVILGAVLTAECGHDGSPTYLHWIDGNAKICGRGSMGREPRESRMNAEPPPVGYDPEHWCWCCMRNEYGDEGFDICGECGHRAASAWRTDNRMSCPRCCHDYW